MSRFLLSFNSPIVLIEIYVKLLHDMESQNKSEQEQIAPPSAQHRQQESKDDRRSVDEKRIPSTINEKDRHVLRDKMKEMFAKIITDIDDQVLTVSESQCELDTQLNRLISTLDSIKVDEKLTEEISANAKRISSLKSRLTLIHTILSNSSERCSRTLAACGAAINSFGSSRPIPSSAPINSLITTVAAGPSTTNGQGS